MYQSAYYSLITASIVIGAVRHTAAIKIRYVQFAFSQTEKPKNNVYTHTVLAWHTELMEPGLEKIVIF